MAELGRTARHYRKNKASRAKHNADNGKGGKYAHTKAYKRAHSKARASLRIRKVPLWMHQNNQTVRIKQRVVRRIEDEEEHRGSNHAFI